MHFKKGLILLSLFICQIAIGQPPVSNSYNVYVDIDNNIATGCPVTPSNIMVQFDGIDGYIAITTGGNPIAITGALYHQCTGGVFDAGSAIVTSALGLNTNINGNDVFEAQMATTDLGIMSSGQAKLYFSAESATSSDIVVVNNNGGGIFAGVAFPIPLFSLVSLLLLALIIYIVANKAHKNKTLIVASVLLFSSVVWGMFTFVIDGQVDDWSSFTPISDPLADNSTPGSFSDITQVFANLEQDLFTARIDVVDVENQAPTANAVTSNVLEDGSVLITMSGADLDGDALTFNVDTPPTNGSVSAVTQINSTSASLIYSPAADYVGNDTFTYVANDGQVNSVPATVDVTVDPVNDAPSFTTGGDVTVLEESGAYSSAWATALTPGPSDESGQTTNFTISNITNPALFSTAPVVDDATGNLSFTPAVDAAGTSTVTINIMDDGGVASMGVDTSANITFDIIITDVNDVPSFTKGADQTVLEDAAAQTVAGWATMLSKGPASESAQTLSFNVSNSDNTLFTVQPAVSATGVLTYTPNTDANGTAVVTISITDSGGTDNSGVDTSASQTFNINVTPVNDEPSFTSGGPVGVLEDSGAYSNAWATAISSGPSDESAQTTSFNVSNNNNSLFSTQPSINAAGQLSFTPAADAFGIATVTVTISDTGGGADTSAAQMFTITLTQVNDIPSFTKGADQTFNQDSGAHTISPWATGLSPGPVNESGQTLGFIVNNNNNSLFSVQPNVNAMGALNFTSAAGLNGTAVVTISIMDNGGTDDGGVNTSASQTFNITILNPPPAKADPSYSVSTNIQLNNPSSTGLLTGATGSGTLTVGNAMNPAPTTTTGGGNIIITTTTGAFDYNPPAGLDIGTDTFVYKICNATQCSADITATLNLSGNTTWFVTNSMTPGDGRLTTPFNSIAAFIAKQGNGGTADPAAGDCIFLDGNHTGSLILLDNQKLIGKGSSTTLAAECGLMPAANSEALPSTNGTDPVLSSMGIGITLAQSNTLRGFDISNATNKILGSNFGTLTINDIALSGTGKAVDLTSGIAAITFDSITTTSSTSEGIDLNAVAGSFTVTNAVNVSNSTNQAIAIRSSAGLFDFMGNLNITSGGILIRDNTSGSTTFSGTSKVVNLANSSTGVDLDSNSSHRIYFINGGLDIDTVSGTALNAISTDITLSGSNNTLYTESGEVFNLSNANTNAEIASVIQNAGTNNKGIDLNNHAGILYIFGGYINNGGGNEAIELTGGSGTIEIATVVVSQGSGLAVDISGRSGGSIILSGNLFDSGTSQGGRVDISGNSGGSISLSGPTKQVNTSTSAAVYLANNTGATINFISGGLDIDTTSGAGFTAIGGGTVNVGAGTAANSINSTTGVAANISSTDIGASNVNFQSISTNGGTGNGIVLSTTGTSGSFIVTGNAVAGSGGIIANKFGGNGLDTAGIGIYLNNTLNPSFSYMQLNGFDNFAIKGANVTGFNLINSVINGVSGNFLGLNEGAINFTNLLGSAAITSSNISGGFVDNIKIQNNTGVLDRLTVMGSTIGLNAMSTGNDGILFESQANAMANISVLNSTFLGARGDMVQCNAAGASSMDCIIRDNIFNNTHTNSVGGGVTITGGGGGSNVTMTYDVSATATNGQTFNGAVSNAITANFLSGMGMTSGKIENNQIGLLGMAGSGSSTGNGISVGANENQVHRVLIQNNLIKSVSGDAGIDVLANGASIMNAEIIGNDINELSGPFPLAAINVISGGNLGDTAATCIDIKTNTLDSSGADFPLGDIFIDQISASSSYNFPGYMGPSTGGAALDNFLTGQNTINGSPVITLANANITGNVATCL